jgi:hypothetical protein
MGRLSVKLRIVCPAVLSVRNRLRWSFGSAALCYKKESVCPVLCYPLFDIYFYICIYIYVYIYIYKHIYLSKRT